jgi:L-alanine-DL-glutamate epimerase-like enolase superfamily enzyme
MSFGSLDARHAVLVELTDEEGHAGVGESWVNYPRWAAWERRAAFEQVYIPYLKGRTCGDIHAFIAEMARDLRGPCVQSRTIGPLIQALCGIELALWDLAAKQQGLPLRRLLFTSPSESVRVYASGLNAPLPWKLIDRRLAGGVTVFKLKMGFGRNEDMENLRRLTDYLGNSARVAIDVNRAWTFNEALEWLKILRDFSVLWLEEPLKPEDEARTGELAAKKMVPLAGGENVWMEPGRDDPSAFARLPFDILQPDITKNVCISDSLELLKSPEMRSKRLYPHFFGSGPGQAASLNLAAGCGDVLQEMDINENVLRTGVFTRPFEVKDGAISLPDTPGIGWELDHATVERLRVA